MKKDGFCVYHQKLKNLEREKNEDLKESYSHTPSKKPLEIHQNPFFFRVFTKKRTCGSTFMLLFSHSRLSVQLAVYFCNKKADNIFYEWKNIHCEY